MTDLLSSARCAAGPLAAAEAALKELKTILGKARLVNGTHSDTTVKKALKAIKN